MVIAPRLFADPITLIVVLELPDPVTVMAPIILLEP